MDKDALLKYIKYNLDLTIGLKNVDIPSLEKSIYNCADNYESGNISFIELCSSICSIRLNTLNNSNVNKYLSDVIELSFAEIGNYTIKEERKW